MDKLTEREKQILDCLETSLASRGFAPSVRDIAASLGIKSTSTVHAALNSLAEKGYIEKSGGKSRAVRIEGGARRHTFKVPLVGKYSGGALLKIENYEGYIDFPAFSHTYPPNDLFAVRAEDDYPEYNIAKGDIAVISKSGQGNGIFFTVSGGSFLLTAEIRENSVILGRIAANIRYY